MKTRRLLLILFFIPALNLYSQIYFSEQIIINHADIDKPESVYTADLDGDGDMDVLSASRDDDKIAWYENLGPVGIVNNDPPVVPAQPLLYDNYPDPFNPETTIEFDVAGHHPVTLKIYDLQGREAATLINEHLPPAHYKVTFNARNLASGVYFYHIRIGDFHAVKKMTLIR